MTGTGRYRLSHSPSHRLHYFRQFWESEKIFGRRTHVSPHRPQFVSCCQQSRRVKDRPSSRSSTTSLLRFQHLNVTAVNTQSEPSSALCVALTVFTPTLVTSSQPLKVKLRRSLVSAVSQCREVQRGFLLHSAESSAMR